MSLFHELSRRNVFRVAAAYLVLSWLLLQVGQLLFEVMGLPEWAPRIVLGVLILGFPIAVVFAWVYELTPEGIRRESEIDRSTSITPHTGRKLDYVTLAALLGVVVFVLIHRERTREASPVAASKPVAVEAAAEAMPSSPEPAAAAALSIAVLPFANLSADAENEYFADGVAEEILNLIAKTPDLRVISRSSAFSFKGRNVPIPEVAEELGVNHVLEGSVRRAGDRVRVTAQLIRVANDAHLWSETYDRTLDDIFAVQDEIATAIAEALQVELGIARTDAPGVDAYELTLKGRARVGRRTAEGIEDAIHLFRRAVELEPDYAEAQGQLAMAYVLRYTWYSRLESGDDLERVEEAAERGLALDENNVPALVALAIHRYQNWEFEASDMLFRRALAANPNSVQANNWYGDFLTIVDRSDEAVIYEKKAVQLDPLLAVHRHNECMALALDQRIDEAVVACKKAWELDPDFPYRQQALLIVGNAADSEFREQLLGARHFTDAERRLLRTFLAGDRQQALDQLRAMRDDDLKPIGGLSSDYLRSLYLVQLGQYDEAVDYINPDVFDDYVFAGEFSTDPDVLRANPRYAAWWHQPPRDRLLKARGHWLEEFAQ